MRAPPPDAYPSDPTHFASDGALRAHLLAGHVIPAHPLALTARGAIDERAQVALTRYYVEAGAGGLAVGVHTTGFRLHDTHADRYAPVLTLARDAARAWCDTTGRSTPLALVAGLVGDTRQAVREARVARDLGYHAGLLSLAAWRDAPTGRLLAHCRAVAEEIPLVGFYLQPAVGGRPLDAAFWRAFAGIERVVAIKVAPFDRYATLDVITGVHESGRRDIALYTGNDDAIVADLVTPWPVPFVGGLLGQWAVWTRRAVTLLDEVRTLRTAGAPVPQALLAHGAALTAANAAIFDPAHRYRGCLPGILHVLRGQGLVRTVRTLDPHERLAPGQAAAIDRLRTAHPELTDDDWVAARRDRWLA